MSQAYLSMCKGRTFSFRSSVLRDICLSSHFCLQTRPPTMVDGRHRNPCRALTCIFLSLLYFVSCCESGFCSSGYASQFLQATSDITPSLQWRGVCLFLCFFDL